jgi:hypothetical protein
MLKSISIPNSPSTTTVQAGAEEPWSSAVFDICEHRAIEARRQCIDTAGQAQSAERVALFWLRRKPLELANDYVTEKGLVNRPFRLVVKKGSDNLWLIYRVINGRVFVRPSSALF